jgi:hypothetical protein
MAVYFITSNPEKLLRLFKIRIQQTEPKGKITTWKLSDDGNDFSHDSDDWRYKAWFVPTIKSDRLTFNIFRSKGEQVRKTVYGYYHGHLIQTFLNHFDQEFTKAIATADATPEDNLT